jgi:hypothetical protein
MKNALFSLILLATGGAIIVDARADSTASTTADASAPSTTDTSTPAADAPATATSVETPPAADVPSPTTEDTSTPAADAPAAATSDAAPPAAEAEAPAPATAVASTPASVDALAPVAAEALPANTIACDVELNVADPDPKGLNVRATPDAKKGKVTAVLKPIGDWTQVHVVGQSGDWLRIDHAEAIDDSAENGQRQVFQGNGWVYASKLGVSELYVGDGTIVRDQPKREGAVILQLDTPDKEPKKTKVLGCNAGYIKVDIDKKVGWTNSWCTNERTTCS